MSEKPITVAQLMIATSNSTVESVVAAMQARHVANGIPRQQIVSKDRDKR
jgi:hypothetical protein